MKKILCVLRTSTYRQEIESQKVDMIDFLKGKGYQDDEVEWLVAKGASARTANKSYLQMLDDIKSIVTLSESIKAVAVWHLNRLGRIESYITAMREWFTQNHIQLYVKNPDITLLNDDGTYNVGNNIVFAVFGATIPADTEETMGKLSRGKKYAKAEGRYTGGFIPFGFKIVDKHLVPDAEQMELVKLVFEEYSTGKYSYYTLQEELHSRNLQFTIRHLALLMKNPIYKEYVGELWDKCEQVRNGADWKLNTKESKYCHLGLKLIKCPHCGKNYIADANRYICLTKKNGKRYGLSCSDSISIKAEVIDTIIWDYAGNEHFKFLINSKEDDIEELKKKQMIIQQKITTQLAEKEKNKVKLDNVIELYMNADISKIKYNSRKAAIVADDQQIDIRIEQMQKEKATIQQTINSLSNPDIINEMQLMLSVSNVEKSEDKRLLCRKYIKYINLLPYTYNDRQCTLIKMVAHDGSVHEFIYDYNADKRWKKSELFDKLYMIKKDGTIVKYSYTGQPLINTAFKAFEYYINKKRG